MMATQLSAKGSLAVESPAAGSRGSDAPGRTMDLDPAYTIEEFLDDQRLLLAGTGPMTVPRTLEEPDGCVIVMPVRSLLHAFNKKRRALSFFSRKYGRGSSVPRLWKFGGVLHFLHDYRADLSRSGLVREGEPMTVREELLRYLLTYDAASVRIPAEALTRFLYDWSHRWL